jgi:hypothetical protein
VSIEEAARRLGRSAHSVRRQIRNGDLYAVREERPNGFAWRVGFEGDKPAPAPVGAHVTQVDDPLQQALALIEKLHAEVIELSGRCGFLQGQLEETRKIAAPAPEAVCEPVERSWWRSLGAARGWVLKPRS